MSTTPSQLWLFRLLIHLRRRSSKAGFTLIELLISIIIVGIIISGLLYLVVEMLQLDRREFVLNQVSTDMNRAMDYITNDVEEAIYVYSNPMDVVSELSDVGADEKPVLAFWRPDLLDQDDLDKIKSSCSPAAECALLKERQAFLTLVVYLQEENTDDSIWNGETRIVRYSLPNYTSITSSLNSKSTPGYNDPTLINGNGFANWVANGTTDGIKQVLVDSVDKFEPESDIDEAACPNPDPANPIYTLSPSTPTLDSKKSFYVCVREASVGTNALGDTINSNQDLIVFLRGNAIANQDGLINALSDASEFPTIQSRVLLRGVRGEEL
ncbi:MAG: prepilin-type N-terminal cleavage/methylation domain-containing protein [Leptolyngbyaceae cyanobacterium SM1_1_3]|nr:prepilin-type N-terminal cleavage/methylation domain-containing protein [Leptolyngbyaceae cyanobacterium SM1_1_3]NJN01380.1 prepilin-type N-terminal cleavage/methylation domain-containing protein [Leptolyngbyaceae cyanobacterium RM1_1_2]NJO10864.1 prepilin-type N-terminal cleavage/methylation domain-containing protein [Leptolyngbyaceae cyanobacterium SL_1_1]